MAVPDAATAPTASSLAAFDIHIEGLALTANATSSYLLRVLHGASFPHDGSDRVAGPFTELTAVDDTGLQAMTAYDYQWEMVDGDGSSYSPTAALSTIKYIQPSNGQRGATMNAVNPGAALSTQDLMTYLDLRDTIFKNACYSAAGLVIGSGSKPKVKIANTVTFTSNGIFKSKTTAECVFTAGAASNITANATLPQERLFILALAADGTPTLYPGALASTAGGALGPERSAISGTPIGSVRILVPAAGTSFVAGTTDLDTAGWTVTYTDLSTWAPRFDGAQ